MKSGTPTNRAIVWSYGGGIQSVAIGLLVHQGKLPKPDLAVIADTGREVQSTWDYLDKWMQPLMESIGLTIEIAPHSLSRYGMYSKKKLLIPAFTQSGKIMNFCSDHWKRRVCMRFVRQRGIKHCMNWIGYSLDEIGRVGKAASKWYLPAYPLLDFDPPLRRSDCVRIIEDFGWPVPKKSRCDICPNQRPEEWLELGPEKLAEVQKLYDNLSAADKQGGVFPTKHKLPLHLIDFQAEIDKREGTLFNNTDMECRGESCWT